MIGYCGICSHWELKISQGSPLITPDGLTEGICHEGPPSPFLIPAPGQGGYAIVTQFPLPHSKMWCGKFEGKITQ